VIAITGYYFKDTFPNSTYKVKVEKEIKVDEGWLYLYKDGSGDDFRYEMDFYKYKQKLVNTASGSECLVLDDYNGLNVLFWILYVIGLGFLILVTFVGWVTDDDDVSWDFRECSGESLEGLVRCDLEDGMYYYTILGRLIGESKSQLRRNITSNFLIYKISDVRKCPRFTAKSKKRDDILNKLGI
jgi:hypothetical protein